MKKSPLVIPDEMSRKMLGHKRLHEHLASLLLDDKPFMVSRFGSIEAEVVDEILLLGNKQLDQSIKSKARNNAGIALPNMATLRRFSWEYMSSMADADVLGIWNFPSQIRLARHTNNPKLCHMQHIDPCFKPWDVDVSWSKSLEGKKVLVIHPFSETILKQYSVFETIKTVKDVLPHFELDTLIPPMTVDRNDDSPDSWNDHLLRAKNKVSEKNFDVAIIGAGSYGAPLASFIKGLGKQAIHIGGATQLLFGIIGRRWEQPGRYEYMSRVVGDGWVRASASETPESSGKIENGCYW